MELKLRMWFFYLIPENTNNDNFLAELHSFILSPRIYNKGIGNSPIEKGNGKPTP
jgi:hypothetical protein